MGCVRVGFLNKFTGALLAKVCIVLVNFDCRDEVGEGKAILTNGAQQRIVSINESPTQPFGKSLRKLIGSL